MPDIPQGEPFREAEIALRDSPILALRELAVVLKNQQVLLYGTVTCFYHKQLAQEVVRSVADGMRVVNRVKVVEPGGGNGSLPGEGPLLVNS